MEKYRYNLSSTDGNSNQYGNCDICNKHTTETFIQIEERYYKFKHNGKVYEGWTQNKCNTYFGHEDCLKSKQR